MRIGMQIGIIQMSAIFLGQRVFRRPPDHFIAHDPLDQEFVEDDAHEVSAVVGKKEQVMCHAGMTRPGAMKA
jgi:hypothetical protein